jgi:hypothetical protein
VRVHISVTKEDLQLIDEYRDISGVSRSKFFVKAALKEVGVHKKDIEYSYPARKNETTHNKKTIK